jgi:hypothetical protein
MEPGLLSIVLGSFVFWVLGAFWYSVAFGKVWQQELGLSDEFLAKANMPVIFGLSFVMMGIMTFGLGFILGSDFFKENGFVVGFTKSLYVGICFALTSVVINYLYQRKSLVLMLIDGAYLVLGLALAGGVLAYMN